MHTGQMLTSTKNPKIKAVHALKERKERDATGRFLIEGYREISRALIGNVAIETLFVAKELFLGENEQQLIQKIKNRGAEVCGVSAGIFEKLSYRDRPDGLVAIAQQMRRSLSDLVPCDETALFVVAEAIEKPGNLGSILRSADAVGATAVIVSDRCTDIYNPNVVRASVGTLFTLPVIETERDVLSLWLQKHSIRIVATTPQTEILYTDISLKGPLAIFVGTEQFGLSSYWMEKAAVKVRIPMQGVADSLNVASATTLLLYEALRQRTAR